MTLISTTVSPELLIPPCGNTLVNLVVPDAEAATVRHYAETLPSMCLSARETCDLEMLATGGFSPLDRFMGEADYNRVIGEMRLASGHIFPIPITLPIGSGMRIEPGQDIALSDSRNVPLAVMTVEEIYGWNRREYADKVLQTESRRHPLVSEMLNWGDRFITGAIRLFRLPRYFDFPELRLTPNEVRSRLSALANPNVVAFQTRNPLHRAHEEMTKKAMESTGGVLLMHPVVGLTRSGDTDHVSRVRAYKALTERYYDADRVLLALVPLAMRFAGPREALWHALIRRNYGANHFIVGRDHASPGTDEHGQPFYQPYAARELVERFSSELGVGVVPFEDFVYLPDTGSYEERSKVTDGRAFISLSGTAVRDDYLNKGERLPDWFVRPEVAKILEDTLVPRHRQGVCLWFTGLSAAGKSTTAEIVTALLTSLGRRVTLLDGDLVRKNLSAGLGFDRAGRDANIRRIGFVAAEIVRHGGVAVCAAISPYRDTRNEVRKMIGGDNFVEIFVDTPLEVCERRDPKGMYAKAREGKIENFTGIDDVYEPPHAAELAIGTTHRTAEENAKLIVEHLAARGFVREEPDGAV